MRFFPRQGAPLQIASCGLFRGGAAGRQDAYHVASGGAYSGVGRSGLPACLPYYDTRARAQHFLCQFDPIGFFSFALGGEEIGQKIIAII